jgi:hypothetical protein
MKASTKEFLDRSHTWFQKVYIETWAIGWVYPVPPEGMHLFFGRGVLLILHF